MWTLILSIFVATVALWLIWRKRKFSYFKRLGIPGPEPSIFFGNLWELSERTPLVCYKEWIQKYGKVVGYYMGSVPIVLVADVELLKKIQVTEFHKFANRPSAFAPPKRNRVKNTDGFSNQMTSMRDKKWKEIRSILTPSFTASKMKQMSPSVNDAIDALMENIDENVKNNEAFDIYQFYQGLTMDIIGRTAFGIQTNVQKDPEDPFLRTARILFSGDIGSLLIILTLSFPEISLLWYSLTGLKQLLQNRGKDPKTELLEMVNNVIELRREDKSNRRIDLLQLMIDAKIPESDLKTVTNEDLTAGNDEVESKVATQIEKDASKSSGKIYRRMNDAEILDNSVLFFLAGYDTTSTALAFATHFLICYPEIQEKIRDEVKNLVTEKGDKLDYTSIQELQYLDQVLTEVLRICPPVYSFDREVGEDAQFGNIKFLKGLVVKVPIYILHHDSELWPDPEKFDPERFAPENKTKNNSLAFQAFAAGPRNCIGMRFAHMEIKLVLARILLKYKLVKCDETEEDPITLKITSFSLAPRNGIKLKAIPC